MISVIVPVYEVEAYIDECVKSIVGQTFSDLEIILVDDGSKDKCPSLCDAWALKDERIKVIHQENGGLSAARNAGIRFSHGEYIGFVDSDDCLHKDMYRFLYDALVESKADVAVCHEQIYMDGSKAPEDREEKMLIEAEETQAEAASHFMDKFTGPISWAWNKLYKRELVEKHCFLEGKLVEDIFFNTDIMSDVQKVVWIKNSLYYYRQRSTGIGGRKSEAFYINYAQAMLHVSDVFSNKSAPDLKKKLKANMMYKIALIETEAWIAGRRNAQKEIRKMFKDYFKENHAEVSGQKGAAKILFARYARFAFHVLKKKQILAQCGIPEE